MTVNNKFTVLNAVKLPATSIELENAHTPTLDKMRARNEGFREVPTKGCTGEFRGKPCNNDIVVVYPTKQCVFCHNTYGDEQQREVNRF